MNIIGWWFFVGLAFMLYGIISFTVNQIGKYVLRETALLLILSTLMMLIGSIIISTVLLLISRMSHGT